MSETIDDEVRGPLRRPRNAYQEAPNSIHNDDVAQRLGMRGGTVAGSVHMDQFPPVLLEVFGSTWFESGSLSLRFINATTDGEPVTAIVARPETTTDAQVGVRMEREDGLLVAEGTASVGRPAAASHLHSIELRASDPRTLRILADVSPGEQLVDTTSTISSSDAVERAQAQLIAEPLDWYVDRSPWGGPIASPSQTVGLLWRDTTQALAQRNGGAVGLFGAIEVRHLAGPVLADTRYRVVSHVAVVGDSPRTEYIWFDSVATDEFGTEVAAMRMQLRWMKASSPHYHDS